ncbi:hypothetical protein Pcinc_036930 [Petrolisthes cinctipes]|uniref:G-protein coupled receptors family 2 profile 2 domain-containing protein n=1 Tax=Petrolisthes cinctipes TaxID=88211 RepID=A0AAE1BXK8_PETCI|nr:hypothetical protein Pcinc_036930 [Petrolisthes cinctipes]
MGVREGVLVILEFFILSCQLEDLPLPGLCMVVREVNQETLDSHMKSIMLRILLVGAVVGLMVCGVRAEGELGVYHQPVYVPRCCKEGYTLDMNRRCVSEPGTSFHPIVGVNISLVVLNEVANEEVTDVSCSGKGITTQYKSPSYGEALFLLNSDESSVNVLWSENLQYEERMFHQAQQYCIALEFGSSKSEPIYVAKLCAEDLCADSQCVKKCCPQGEHIVDFAHCEPVVGGQEWEPVFHDEDGVEASPPTDLHMLYGFPEHCAATLMYDDHKLLQSGNVQIPDWTLTYQEYCIDNIFTDNITMEMAVVCYKEIPSYCAWKHMIMKPVLLGVSCVCLALTWLVYVWVQQLRTSTTGRCLICLVSAMFVAFLTIILLELHMMDITPIFCVVLGYISLYSILATFFWLSIISFHIFLQVRSGKQDGPDRLRVFLRYCLVGWGAPTIMVVLGIALDASEVDVIRPGFYPNNCWFFDDVAQWCYQYAIILALLILNTIFFIFSIVALKKKESYSPNSANNSHHCFSFWVYFKMFIIMGILWFMEVVVWALDRPQCSILVIIFDVINCLQGVYIFLVVVCFRKDLKVFHCGLPKMLVCREDTEAVSNTQEVHGLVDAKR